MIATFIIKLYLWSFDKLHYFYKKYTVSNNPVIIFVIMITSIMIAFFILALSIVVSGRDPVEFNKIKTHYFQWIYYYDQNQNAYHRLDGPAVIVFGQYEEWWYRGKEVPVTSQKEFEKWLKLKAFQ